MGVLVFRSFLAACLGEGYLLAGRGEEARDVAHRALEIARVHKERGNQAWIARLLGEIASCGAHPGGDQAEVYYRRALALAEPRGMGPLVAHCRLGLGKLYRGTGRDEQARTELAAAAEVYRSMGMAFWLSEAEAELAKIG